MDPNEFTNHMARKFPSLLQTQELPLAIREGWYPIVENFFAKLQEFYTVDPRKEEWENTLEFKAIKEKFGTLRISFVAPISIDQRRELLAIINDSSRTCEVCGQQGQLITDSIGFNMRTRCEMHM